MANLAGAPLRPNGIARYRRTKSTEAPRRNRPTPCTSAKRARCGAAVGGRLVVFPFSPFQCQKPGQTRPWTPTTALSHQKAARARDKTGIPEDRPLPGAYQRLRVYTGAPFGQGSFPRQLWFGRIQSAFPVRHLRPIARKRAVPKFPTKTSRRPEQRGRARLGCRETRVSGEMRQRPNRRTP